MEPQGRSLTVREVAEALRVSRYTVYELIKRGQLPAYRVGSRVRVAEEALARFTRARPGAATAEGVGVAAEVQQQEPRRLEPPPGTLLLAASHDLAVELLVASLRRRRCVHVLPSYVGSGEALLALREGAAQVAGCHLWDAETGQYNLPFLRRLAPAQPFRLLHLAARWQGFLLAPGNPLGITSWEDLGRPGLRIVNRQPGSGTRLLLDAHLQRLGIPPRRLAGYDREVRSHLEAAVAVLRGQAELALGIEAVARALGLAFVPLQREVYELVLREEDAQRPWARALAEELRSAAFRAEVAQLGGYETEATGEERRFGGA